jgi:chaperonin GroES
MKIPDIKVLGARLVLAPEKIEEKTASGIILPTAAQEENHVGTVVVVGPGQRFDNGAAFPMDINVGDRVMYLRTAGVPVQYDGEDYLVINEAHILAIFPKKES